MKFFMFFIIFAIFYGIFNFIIKKTDFHNKLFTKFQIHKYTKIIFVLIFFSLAFLFEYTKQLLNDSYGKYNYLNIILASFLSSIYFNFAPLIFKRKK
jgi:hypothetical protein